MKKLLFLIFVGLFGTACGSKEVPVKDQQTKSDSISTKAQQGTPFTGRVVFLDFEGGFWGVVTSDGQHLNGGLPVHLRINNQPVKGRYSVQEGMVSFQMWGEIVEFHSIEPIGSLMKKTDSNLL